MNHSMQEAITAGTITPDVAGELWPYFVDTARFMVNAE